MQFFIAKLIFSNPNIQTLHYFYLPKFSHKNLQAYILSGRECNWDLFYIANFLDPFAKLMGMDGYILSAFILGIPANEIVLPIILMSYLATGSLVDMDNTFAIGEVLKQNGWTLLTGINVMIFTLLHFPCSTTLMSIKKESGSTKWTLLAFALPTVCGIAICMITTGMWNLIF